MVCCRQRLYSPLCRFHVKPRRGRANIRSGFGSVFVVDTNLVLTGTLGEGPARFFERELFFAWFLLGITCLRVLAPLLAA
jgi:hypothetical protein